MANNFKKARICNFEFKIRFRMDASLQNFNCRNPVIIVNIAEDTTPPVLTFIRKEALTVNHAWITWSVNEPASANCTLTTPFTTAVFSCDSGLWSGFGLLGGSYGLGIRLLDRGNNAAGPFVHKWLNGEYWKKKTHT